MEEKKHRRHPTKFRVEIAERMLAGENVMALGKQYGLARSMMYRWRDAYRKKGANGLTGQIGQRSRSSGSPGPSQNQEERLRQRIAELERKVGQQTIEIDFFRGVFKRLEEQPKAKSTGGAVSTRRSDG